MENSKKIGNEGERLVSQVLSKLPASNFKLYNNVMFKHKSYTTQIDHLLVSTRGIFIIETKAHKGMIFGDTHSKYWTQCLYGKGGQINKYKFYSPYLQNIAHYNSAYYQLNEREISCIICFTSDSVDLSNVNCGFVTHISNLYNIIVSTFNNSPTVDYNFYDMCKKVERLNVQSSYYDRKHIKYVNKLNGR